MTKVRYMGATTVFLRAGCGVYRWGWMNSSCDALAPNSAPPQSKEHVIPSEARDLHRQIRFPLEIPRFARDEVASGCCRLLQHSLCSTIIHLELKSHSSEDLYDSATAAGAGAD